MKDKKKILVVDYQFCLGGVAIAALNFIENLKDEYDITLLLARRGGELESRLPEGVKIEYMEGDIRFTYMNRSELKSKNLAESVKRKFCGVVAKFSNSAALKILAKNTPKVGNFDLVVNNDLDYIKGMLSGPCHGFSVFASGAKQKWLVIHGDIKANNYIKMCGRNVYSYYDKVIIVSENMKKQAIELLPQHRDKFFVLSNFQDIAGIKRLASAETVEFDKSVINFVSVSRLCELKGYKRSLDIVKRLVDEGFKFYWHIIGEGELREYIENFVRENKLEKYVKLLGVKKNPFPYMKAADFLFLPSFHEAYGLVIIEANIVGTPSLATDLISTREILKEEQGHICENSNEGIYEGLKYMLNPSVISDFKSKLKNYEFDNEVIKKEFRRLFENE